MNTPTIGRDTATTARSGAAAIVLVGSVGYAALGWVLNGLGAVLPPLRDEVGDVAGVYPLIPGAAMLGTAVVIARRQRRVAPGGGVGAVGWAMGALAVSLLAMGLTRWPAVSVGATVVVALAAARLGRTLPGVLAALGPEHTNRLLMRVNGFSSLAGVVAPLSVGAALAVGIGWLPGYAGPVVAGAVVVGIVARRHVSPGPDPAGAAVPVSAAVGVTTFVPGRRSTAWRSTMLLLTLSIVVEFCFTYFAATYLSEELDLSNAAAAAGGAGWGIGMAVGRLAGRRLTTSAIGPSLAVIGAGFAAMWLAPHPVAAVAGFVVAGLGAAPLYPNLLTALIERFPGPADQAATYGLMSSGIALVSAPGVMVALRATSDVRTAYLVVPVLLLVLAAITVVDRRS